MAYTVVGAATDPDENGEHEMASVAQAEDPGTFVAAPKDSGPSFAAPMSLFATADRKAVNRLWWGPVFVIFALIAAGSIDPFWPVWFWYHPTAMLLAYVAFMGNAVLIKQLGGRTATKCHAYLMASGTLAAAFGWYVIHSNKEMAGKRHFMTTHGVLGLMCLLATFLAALAGSTLLDPDHGAMNKSKLIRFVHKYGGRTLIVFAFFVSVLGWNTNKQEKPLPVLLFSVPLAGFALILVQMNMGHMRQAIEWCNRDIRT